VPQNCAMGSSQDLSDLFPSLCCANPPRSMPSGAAVVRYTSIAFARGRQPSHGSEMEPIESG
jgi:hypothetical protein